MRGPTQRSRRCWYSVLLLGVALHAVPSFAEEAGLEPIALPARPIPIATPDIADRGDSLARELRQMREKLAPAQEVEAIAATLEVRAETLAQRRDDAIDTLTTSPTLARLGELEREWSRLEVELAGWRRSLTKRAASLEADVSELRDTQSIWTATLEGAAAGAAPPEVQEAVRRALADIKTVRRAASERRSEVLALQNRISQRELLIAETLAAVQAARVNLRSRLLEPDDVPIWSALAADETATGERIIEAFEASWATIQDFLLQRRGRLVAFAAVFLAAWLAALGLKRSVAGRRAAGGEIEDSSRVFRRPIALALLSSLLSVFWLFPFAPEALLDIVGLLLLIPMLRLLPKLMHPGFRPILYGLAGFYLLDRLRDVFERAPLESRVVLALECLGAVIFCLALLRPARLAKIPDPERFPSWPGRVVQIGLVGFTAAFAANLLGYVSLAGVLGDGLLTSIYVAVGLYGAARVFGVVLDVTTKTAWAQQINFLRVRRVQAVKRVRSAFSVAAFVLWLYWSLAAFAVRDTVLGGLSSALTSPLAMGTVSISLGDVLGFGLTIAVAIFLARFIRFVLMEDFFPRVRTGRGIPHAVSATVQYAILFGGFLLAMAAAGLDFSRFTLLAGAFGVGIGFGLQNVVNNFVSGIILLYERPIQVGDTIDMGDLMGQVKRIGIRSSTVRTFTGSEVIVPNADLISQRVINWTLSDKTRRVDIPIGVKYGSDPDEVIRILLSVAEASGRALRYPAPAALFRTHGESSLDFELRLWIANFDDWYVVESELNTAINRGLAEAGIEIPFPQRDLHLRSSDLPAAGLPPAPDMPPRDGD